MIMGKYGAVIGLEEPIARGIHNKTRFWTNHSAVFPHDHQTTEFRQTTVKASVVDPSHHGRLLKGDGGRGGYSSRYRYYEFPTTYSVSKAIARTVSRFLNLEIPES